MSSGNRRKELNRLAAQKLRNKQKEKALNIRQDYFVAQSKYTQLSYEHKQLLKTKEELVRQLESHLRVCRRPAVPANLLTRSASVPTYANIAKITPPVTPIQPPLTPLLTYLGPEGVPRIPSAGGDVIVSQGGQSIDSRMIATSFQQMFVQNPNAFASAASCAYAFELTNEGVKVIIINPNTPVVQNNPALTVGSGIQPMDRRIELRTDAPSRPVFTKQATLDQEQEDDDDDEDESDDDDDDDDVLQSHVPNAADNSRSSSEMDSEFRDVCTVLRDNCRSNTPVSVRTADGIGRSMSAGFNNSVVGPTGVINIVPTGIDSYKRPEQLSLSSKAKLTAIESSLPVMVVDLNDEV